MYTRINTHTKEKNLFVCSYIFEYDLNRKWLFSATGIFDIDEYIALGYKS